MDLLNRKATLLTVCLLGAMVLVADDDESEDTPQQPNEKTQVAIEPNSPETPVENESISEPAHSNTQSSQSTELKPLELQERIRAHANIDLPQDI